MARTQGSHSDTTRPRVRASALRLFAQHGYAAVSMRQIAGDVGVQAGALYNYTPDKQSLLFDLLKTHMDTLLAAWSAQELPDDPVAALEVFTRFHIRFHSKRPEEVFISYMELRNLSPDNFTVIEKQRSSYEKALEAILVAGIKAGTFNVPEPKVAAMAIIAMLTGVNTWYSEAGRLSLEEIEEAYWALVGKSVSA